MAQDEPSEAERAELEELAHRMQAELRNLTASELLAQTGVTLVNLAAARMGMVEGMPDEEPTEARAAIDALAAILPVLDQHAPGPLVGDLRAGLAQLQMAFVELGGVRPQDAAQAPETAPEPPGVPRAKIWTPGGDV
jgi:hypothetical protein